ncbi:SGNH/GDSL hydrolase family protein [Nocardioides donggukensis]|uniref:SGNH/GDSL hydrolase family protein n=1 Tax=Nocardioides donggukensis TaxID=2774019 RepID=A0A927PZE7_9ACTN|nr:SGNH/GDSL hydrolase family protein [Nocardioides donggukensis]MBD8868995.1 SGNH/GDSL hydrolase family protein [Nocardioides donggukensis]
MLSVGLGAGLFAALLAGQGRRVRARIACLPAAVEPDGRHGRPADPPWHLVVLGDSVAAGVGVPHHGVSLAGLLAERLVGSTSGSTMGPTSGSRCVRRSVVAGAGLTAAGVLAAAEECGDLATADAVVVSVGVNDTKNLHSVRRWRRELTALLDGVTRAAPGTPVVLLGIPPLHRFVALPAPLRHVLGARGRRLDGIGRRVATGFPAVRRVELDDPDLLVVPDPFAVDGFHPSERLHAAFAERIHRVLGEVPTSG